MPESLTDHFISDEYTSLLHLSASSLRQQQHPIYDGIGNASSISIALSGYGATVTGTLSASQLKVGGLTFPASDGVSGQVISTDGNGTLSFTNKSSLSSEALIAMFEILYPVGEIYITRRYCSPDTWLGIGVWELYGKGKTLVGIDPDDNTGDNRFNTLDATGGSKTVSLSSSQLPRHRHDFVGDAGGVYYAINSKKSAPTDTSAINFESGEGLDYGGEAQANPYTGYTGEGAAHSNVQPYIVVYFWKRIQ